MLDLIVIYLLGAFTGGVVVRLYLEKSFRRIVALSEKAEDNLKNSREMLRQLKDSLDKAEKLAKVKEELMKLKEEVEE